MQTKGARLLRRWMRRTETSQGQVAKSLGVVQSSVCRWLQGEQEITLRSALKLERMTMIPARAWLEP